MFDSNSEESKALERAVVAKMMTRLIPFLAILYVFCLLDRGNVSIAALTMQKDLSTLRQFMAHGAVGYVTKNAGQQELYDASMAVSSGKKYVCTEVSEVLKLAAANRATTPTRRETEVVRHIVAGLSSREIAGKLFLSLKTVEAHRGNVFRKLKVKNVAELIRKAREEGL